MAPSSLQQRQQQQQGSAALQPAQHPSDDSQSQVHHTARTHTVPHHNSRPSVTVLLLPFVHNNVSQPLSAATLLVQQTRMYLHAPATMQQPHPPKELDLLPMQQTRMYRISQPPCGMYLHEPVPMPPCSNHTHPKSSTSSPEAAALCRRCASSSAAVFMPLA
jgi:hypothetical protein